MFPTRLSSHVFFCLVSLCRHRSSIGAKGGGGNRATPKKTAPAHRPLLRPHLTSSLSSLLFRYAQTPFPFSFVFLPLSSAPDTTATLCSIQSYQRCNSTGKNKQFPALLKNTQMPVFENISFQTKKGIRHHLSPCISHTVASLSFPFCSSSR